MPRTSTAGRQEYERARQERRRNDPEYKERRREYQRRRYNEDPEYRARVRVYQNAWRKGQPRDPTTARNRATRMIWTPEQERKFEQQTVCEICGQLPNGRGMFADHCHDCRHYRGALCQTCNFDEAILRKWQAVCPEGSPMRAYLERHVCEPAA